MSLTPADLVDYASRFGTDPSTVRRWTQRRIVDADPGLAGSAWFALIILERNQLILRVGNTGNGQEIEFEIMPFDAYLLELLSTPDPAATDEELSVGGTE